MSSQSLTPRSNTSVASSATPGQRIGTDPGLAQRFTIEIDSLIAAIFTECSGLSITTDVKEQPEGGRNQGMRQLLGVTKYGHITLKRGMTESHDLWDWYMKVVQGTGTAIERKTITISLMDNEWQAIKSWTFIRAVPVKWEGPSFNAGGTTVAIETLEIAHEGLNNM